MHTQSSGRQIVFICRINLFGVSHPLKRTSFLQVIKKKNQRSASLFFVCLFLPTPPHTPKQIGKLPWGCFCSCALIPAAPSSCEQGGLDGLRELRDRHPDKAWGWSGRLCWLPVFICQPGFPCLRKTQGS